MKPQSVPIIKAVERVVAMKMEAIDLMVEQMVNPLSDVGNPEKLIGKNYDSWTPEDLMRLTEIYKPNPKVLDNLIFRREYEKVKAMEAQVEVS